MAEMRRVAEFIARRRAWQIFLALIAPMILLQLFVMGKMLPLTEVGDIAKSELLQQLVQRTLILTLVMLLVLFAWLDAIALVSNQLIKPSLRPALRGYAAAMIYALTYCALAVHFFPGYISNGQEFPAPIVVMHIAATAANLYVLAFTAKSLVLAEKQSEVSFSDYFGTFVQVWFFPIGVWFVQRRVNKLRGAL
jgi:hypothetical protein